MREIEGLLERASERPNGLIQRGDGLEAPHGALDERSEWEEGDPLAANDQRGRGQPTTRGPGRLLGRERS